MKGKTSFVASFYFWDDSEKLQPLPNTEPLELSLELLGSKRQNGKPGASGHSDSQQPSDQPLDLIQPELLLLSDPLQPQLFGVQSSACNDLQSQEASSVLDLESWRYLNLSPMTGLAGFHTLALVAHQNIPIEVASNVAVHLWPARANNFSFPKEDEGNSW